jgi:hypothetical protein
MQDRIDASLDRQVARFSARKQTNCTELLVRGMLRGNIAPYFLMNQEFRAFQSEISEGRYTPITRQAFFATVKEMSRRIATVVERNMKIPVYVSIEEDAWSSAGRKFSAVTAGGPGIAFSLELM